MAAKLSKKELQGPDIFQSTLEKFGDYVSENKLRFYVIVATIAGAIVIALVLYLYWSNYQSSALKIYAKAQNNIIKSGEKPGVAKENAPLFKEIIDKYPHSWSAKMAHYHLGNTYYSSGDIDSAIIEYRQFVSSVQSDNTGVKYLALTSLGYCFEAKRDLKEALNNFEEAQKTYNVGFEATGFRNIARIYEELKDKKKALENYENALKKTTDPATIIFIKRKISSLS